MVEGKRFKKVHLEVGAGRRHYLLREALEKPEAEVITKEKFENIMKRLVAKNDWFPAEAHTKAIFYELFSQRFQHGFIIRD